MRYTILAAASVASLTLSGALSSAAFAQAQYQGPAIHGNSSMERHWGADLDNNQPSGGYAEDSLQAPTGNLSGASMGAANMNGRNRNGQPSNPYLQNGDSPAAQGF